MKHAFSGNDPCLLRASGLRNSPIFWESKGNIDFLHTFLKRKLEVDRVENPRLREWLERLDQDRVEPAREFWYETLRGIARTAGVLPGGFPWHIDGGAIS
jgi:hypothetical protein